MFFFHGLTTSLIVPAIHFIADDQGTFVSSLGLIFDAGGLLGASRSKVRFPYVLFLVR